MPGRREEAGAADSHTSGSRSVPSLLPNPWIKNQRVGRRRKGGDRELRVGPGRCSALRINCSPTEEWEGEGGTGAFAKVLNGRGFSVSRESYDFFFFCLGKGTGIILRKKDERYVHKRSRQTFAF